MREDSDDLAMNGGAAHEWALPARGTIETRETHRKANDYW